MKYLTHTLLLLLIPFYQVFGKPTEKTALEIKAIKQFDSYSPRIELTKGKILYRKTIIKDLNNDGFEDVIIQFGTDGNSGGNIAIIVEAAIYINYNGNIKVAGGFEQNFCFNIREIKDSVIFVEEFDSCINHSFVKLRKFRFEKSKLIEI